MNSIFIRDGRPRLRSVQTSGGLYALQMRVRFLKKKAAYYKMTLSFGIKNYVIKIQKEKNFTFKEKLRSNLMKSTVQGACLENSSVENLEKGLIEQKLLEHSLTHMCVADTKKKLCGRIKIVCINQRWLLTILQSILHKSKAAVVNC
ncbi:hypothetical protein CEXT_410741 [Caerostris extrusa]|uniref:Uncharacterized protein n=1 Tax=Caerostris extrusa TaxID=172846 RepID=A0AAV4RBH7_CAEEX|nr:hypothetical protein CEXT_410741 [Caerostris extrusa]